MVWKQLAGIEDGFDNGWMLIGANAGSLVFLPLRLECALFSSELQKSEAEARKSYELWPCIACVPGAELSEPIGRGSPGPCVPVRLVSGQKVIRVPRWRSS